METITAVHDDAGRADAATKPPARPGGPEAHGPRSGMAHLVAQTEDKAFEHAREVASLFENQGAMNLDGLAERDLGGLLPQSPNRAYDVRPLIDDAFDGACVELLPKRAPNVVTALGRLGGRTAGVPADNPSRIGRCPDSKSAGKTARFVRTCDAFGRRRRRRSTSPATCPASVARCGSWRWTRSSTVGGTAASRCAGPAGPRRHADPKRTGR